MKVKDLINKLNQFDSELEIVHFSEYDKLTLEINDILQVEAEKTRSDIGKALLKFGSSDSSQTYLSIELTSDI